MGTLYCLFSPVSCAATTVAKATLGGLFNALTGWILASVQWLLGAASDVLASASESSTVVRAAGPEFNTLLAVSPLLMVIGLSVSTLQALRRADGSALWRAYLGVAPACVLAIASARPLCTLVLDAINQLSSAAASSVGHHEAQLARAFTTLTPATPGFGLFLLAAGVAIGCWLLWCELIVRTVVLTVLLVLVPLVVPLSTFPALRRVGWRLAETFLAVAASKYLIVIALTLGFDELLGSSTTQIMTGLVTLLLATASPYLLLRIVPFVEQSALHNLDGVRQRFTRAVQQAPSSPVATAARAVLPQALPPEPPERPEDLGFGMWEGSGEIEMPPLDGESGPPPIGQPLVRGGHVVYRKDDIGPIVGWHFDE